MLRCKYSSKHPSLARTFRAHTYVTYVILTFNSSRGIRPTEFATFFCFPTIPVSGSIVTILFSHGKKEYSVKLTTWPSIYFTEYSFFPWERGWWQYLSSYIQYWSLSLLIDPTAFIYITYFHLNLHLNPICTKRQRLKMQWSNYWMTISSSKNMSLLLWTSR